jgi:signal transduction histidine kinase
MSLGLRLTLMNGLVLLLTLSAFATIAYVTQFRSLQSGLDTSLQNEAGRLIAGANELVERGAGRPRVFPNRGFVGPDVFIQITGSDGSSIARSMNLEGRSLPTNSDAMQRALQGQQWFETVEAEGEPLRMLVTPLVIGPPNGLTTVGMVQVARPLGPAYRNLNTLQGTLLRLGAVSVLVSLIIGWLLARGALRPIDHLADAAGAIGAARDFRRRVPVPRGQRKDEVGRLATEFNEMLGQLQSAYEQLETALAAQRRFVADASHELRTPLTSLRGNVDLLARMNAVDPDAPNASEMEEVLGDMAAETERVTRLVADLLLLARVDAGQHLALAPIELGPLVREAFRSARFLREGIELRLADVPPGAWLSGDSDRLKQLLLILLDNALKYSTAGGEVTIGARAERRRGSDAVGIWVKDAGPGIASEHQDRIFERFYRVAATRSTEGAGLGLAIARWIAEEHGGTIELESEVGQGSTFTVWLPAVWPPVDGARADAADQAPSAERAPVPSASPA